MILNQICSQCNIKFIAKRSSQKFCSTSCKTLFFNDLKRKEPKKEVQCKICNKTFITWKIGHSYCSTQCRKEANVFSFRSRPRKTDRNVLLARESRTKHLSSLEKDIIHGSLLGDGSVNIQSNQLHSFRLGHSEHQLDYLLFKIQQFNFLFQAKPSSFIGSLSKTPYFQISSISHSDITEVVPLFYRDKKRLITQKTLNLLNPNSLLIWYLDDGSYVKRIGSCKIATNSYTLSEVRMMSKWFWHQHRIKATCQQNKKKCLDGSISIYYSLYIVKDSTNSFFDLLRTSDLFNILPTCMLYKFGIIK